MNTSELDTFQNAISHINGTPELSASWVAAHKNLDFDFVDVREPHELTGPLGAAQGVTNTPLASFLESLPARDSERAVVIVCRSGRRSGLAAEACRTQGLKNVASVEGGMLAWNQQVLDRHNIHAVEREANTHNLSEAIYRDNGVPEVSVHWVFHNMGRFRLIDVRQPAELVGPLGRVLQSENIPLNEILEVAKDWPKEDPLVVMCQSGGRSARATMSLIHAGFSNVASMEGGMMAWGA